MEYLVSAENTPYQQWQLELLIESFKHHNCEKDLLVCLSESDTPIHPSYWRNISDHKRIQGHENIGKTRGYKGLNALYDLSWAVQNKWITQPFAFIPTDVVLKEKLNVGLQSEYPEIVFNPSPFFTLESAEEAVGPFWEVTNKNKADYESVWVPLGPIIIFNKIPEDLFSRAIILAERLALKQLLRNQQIWEHTAKLAWAMNLSDFVSNLLLRGDYKLTMNMLESGNSPFIHYEHGLPPVFNKVMFQYPEPDFISFGDPFEILAANSPTRNAHFISELAKKSLAARPLPSEMKIVESKNL
jgi:hypothetical protein